MATRMQQRRGTAAQWVSSNAGDGPILNAGEIGWESDTNKFKIGDGVSYWDDLTYFVDATDVVAAALGGYLENSDIGAISGVAGLDASKNLIVPGTSIIIEGATADAYETTLTVVDPTAARTITFPNATGTVALTASPTFTGTVTATDVTISGSLVVNGTTTTVNSSTLTVDDKNIALGSIVSAVISSTGTVGTVSGTGPYTSTITNMVTTTGLVPGAVITATNGTGDFGSGTVQVVTIASATSITVSSNLAFNAGTVTDITATGPTDTSADGGGITVKGTTDKTFNWVDSTDAWTSSEHLNLASGKAIYLNGTLETATAQTLTNKTIALGSNTVSGTLAQFNTAVTDADLVSLAGAETLTNKTLTSPTISDPTFTGQASGLEIAFAQSIVFEGTTADAYETTLSAGEPTADRTITLPNATDTLVGKATTDTLTNKTLSSAILTGTLTAGAGTGSAGQYLESTGSGVQWTTVTGYAAPTLGSTSIASGATVTTIVGLTKVRSDVFTTLDASGYEVDLETMAIMGAF